MLQSFFKSSPGLQFILLLISASYLALCLLLVSLPYRNETFLKSTDLIAFITGAKVIAEGKNINYFDLQTHLQIQNSIIELSKDYVLAVRNPPIISYLFLPFININIITAYLIYSFINLLLIFLSGTIITKTLKLPKYYIATLLFFWPTVMTIAYGQISIITSIFLFSGVYYLFKKNDFKSGILFALLNIKPQLLIVIPFMLMLSRNKKLFILGLLTTTSVFWGVNYLVFGPNVIPNYLNFIITTEKPEYGSRLPEMFTFASALELLLKTSITSKYVYLLINFSAYLASLLFFHKFQSKTKNFHIKISFAIFLTIIFSVHMLSHDLILLIYPLLLLMHNYQLSRQHFVLLVINTLFLLPMLSLFSLAPIGFILLLIFSILIMFKPNLTSNLLQTH